MNDFDIKKFLTENKMTRNSRLLKEETTMDRLEAHAGFDTDEDGVIRSDQGFVFDNKGNKLSAALVYTDYGSDREEGERALDPLVDELEKQLENAGAEYKITTTGRAYLVDIMIENLNEAIENDIMNSELRVKLNNDGLKWLENINADSIWRETDTEYYALPKDDPYMDEDDYWIMHPNDLASVHLPKRFFDIV